MKTYSAILNGENLKIAIVISRFNDFITTKLFDGAYDCLIRHSVSDENISLFWVPGAFEIPIMAKKIAEKEQYDAIITLGAVIRGETPHFDLVSAEVAKGVASVSISSKMPVVFGVLTTDSTEQAIERAGVKAGNKGFEAAMSAIEMANLYKQL